MSHSDSPCAQVADDDTTQGQVKWFNSSSGYGFITYTDEGAEKDVFVHHTALKTGVDQYKYLVQGEYVKFTLAECEGHDCQASQVWGSGGKLMCEVHFENKSKRQSYGDNRHGDQSDDDGDEDVARRPRRGGGGEGGRSGGRGGGGGGRGGGGRGTGSRRPEAKQMTDEDGNVWTLVPKRARN